MTIFTVVFVGLILILAACVTLVMILRKQPGFRRRHGKDTQYMGQKRRRTDVNEDDSVPDKSLHESGERDTMITSNSKGQS